MQSKGKGEGKAPTRNVMCALPRCHHEIHTTSTIHATHAMLPRAMHPHAMHPHAMHPHAMHGCLLRILQVVPAPAAAAAPAPGAHLQHLSCQLILKVLRLHQPPRVEREVVDVAPHLG